MSAFIVGTDHIGYLVSAAVEAGIRQSGFGICWDGERVEWHNADSVGAALLRENIASVSFRYQDHGTGNLPGPIPNPVPEDYTYQPFVKVDAAQVLKAVDCLEYQSCEHPAWKDSEARRFCDVLRRRYSAMMPGYDEVLWEVDRAELLKQAMLRRRQAA
jgi:hypothetical protein